MKKGHLSVAIIVDYMGSMSATPEEEIEGHKNRFSNLFPGYSLKFSTPRCVLPELSADLVIYDFGGLMPGTSLMEDNSRQIIKWASDHPSSLVVVVSTFTYEKYIKPEIEELGLQKMVNVIPDSGFQDNPIPSWFGK